MFDAMIADFLNTFSKDFANIYKQFYLNTEKL